MSGATFSRLKNWNPEILTNTDLNAEIDNILNHLDPSGVGDYSDTVAMMRLQTDPGTVGSESLATSLAGELERIRFVLKRMLGSAASYWYETPLSDFTNIVAILGSQLFTTRIVSGRTTGNSSQLCALIPGAGTGTAANIILSASVTPFIYTVAGQNVTISTNKTISGLSLASGSNNTATGDVFVYGNSGYSQWAKAAGQYGNKIICNSVGPGAPASGFTNATGTFIAVQNVQATPSEVFLAFMENNTCMTNTWRGCFHDSAGVGIVAQSFTGGITTFKLMKLTWIFADVNGSLAVTYSNPFVGSTQPSSPGIGDYWFDLTTTAWKTFTSTTWAMTNAIMIGFCTQDTQACIGARTLDSYVSPDPLNTMTLDSYNTTTVRERGMFSQLNVFGTKINFGPTKTVWDAAANIDPATTLGINNPYYLYVKENGTPLVSDVAPQIRRDLEGYYHPRETWRAVGSVWTDNNTQFTTPLRTFRELQTFMLASNPEAYLTQSNLSAGQAVARIRPDYFQRQNSAGTATFPNAAANTYYDLTTLSLTPGLWSISAMAQAEVVSGTPAAALWRIGISVNGTAAFTDRKDGYNAAAGAFTNWALITSPSTASTTSLTQTGFVTTLTIPDCWMQVTSPTQVYLKALCVATAASANIQLDGWGINARRIDDLGGG